MPARHSRKHTDSSGLFAEALKDARRKAGLSQGQLAQWMQLSPALVGRAEVGLLKVSAVAAAALAVGCDASRAALLQAWSNDQLVPQGYVCALDDQGGRPPEPLRQVIRQKRKSLGLRQAEVARLVGTATGLICQWELGHSRVKFRILVRLSRVLDLDLAESLSCWLFDAVGHPFGVKAYDL
ncbi:MAG: helix-turn-helix domain-containing protein [Sphingomonas sp.]|nr:MAG: helix-turn-helix domain-containing protein [Sphingomonas sp.]